MIGLLIIACEIGFWLFVIGGLTARYVWKKKNWSTFLLICTPIVDVFLLIFTIVDLKNGAVATTVHGIAAIYIGVSIGFGPQMIRWADGYFNYWFGNGEKPVKVKYGKAYAKRERQGWYRHLLSWIIGGGILLGMILYIGDISKTERLLNILYLWSFVVLVDFIISFSYSLFPRRQ